MKRITNQKSTSSRSGAAIVEFAILSPMLVLLILGGIDMGQFVNTGQVVSNASRVGVRKATLIETKNTSDVTDSVVDYISQYVPGLNRSTIAAATTVTVKLQGSTISGTTLGAVPTGQRLDVSVSFQYQAVRWIPFLTTLNGRSLVKTSMMRKE
jgi:Flp pilus assembly protein TadG